MKKYLAQIENFWIENFLTRPNNLKALRIMVSVLFSLFIFYFIGYPKEGLLVGMGIVAAALTENDIHAKSALRSMPVIMALFVVFSSLTNILYPYPVRFVTFLVISTFSLTLAGGYKAKYSNLAFGSVITILYTMITNSPNNEWYEAPFLFAIGVFIYMIVTIFIFIVKPFHLIQNEIATGYRMLAKYLKTKSKFFPSNSEEQEEIRNELALINVELFSQTEKIKKLLQNFDKIVSNSQSDQIQKYISEWNKLQSLHERAVSSHEPYDLISQQSGNSMLVEGFGKILKEIGEAIDVYAANILEEIDYKTSESLSWTKNALKIMVDKYDESNQDYIAFLLKNIISIEENLSEKRTKKQILQKVGKENTSIKEMLTISNPRFRHAVRLSFCFFIGYVLMILFKIELGGWILLTSFIVCQQTYDATRQRFFRRIVGTFLGVIIGIILAILVPTDLGQLAILLCSIYLFFKYVNTDYITAAIFITVYVLEVFNIQNGSGIQMMLPRIIDTLIGSVLAYFSIRFIWPEWQYKNLRPLLVMAIDKNIRYFQSVMDSQISDIDYLHNQRSAHRADNSLTQVWKGMRIEPKSKRKLLTSARNFTYLNHTLISYISAFGVHRKSLNISEENHLKKLEIIEILNEVKSLIQGNGKISSKESEENIKAIQNSDDVSDNELFLKNILNVSDKMKEATQGLEF